MLPISSNNNGQDYFNINKRLSDFKVNEIEPDDAQTNGSTKSLFNKKSSAEANTSNLSLDSAILMAKPSLSKKITPTAANDSQYDLSNSTQFKKTSLLPLLMTPDAFVNSASCQKNDDSMISDNNPLLTSITSSLTQVTAATDLPSSSLNNDSSCQNIDTKSFNILAEPLKKLTKSDDKTQSLSSSISSSSNISVNNNKNNKTQNKESFYDNNKNNKATKKQKANNNNNNNNNKSIEINSSLNDPFPKLLNKVPINNNNNNNNTAESNWPNPPNLSGINKYFNFFYNHFRLTLILKKNILKKNYEGDQVVPN
jgi:hypothetical protein